MRDGDEGNEEEEQTENCLTNEREREREKVVEDKGCRLGEKEKRREEKRKEELSARLLGAKPGEGGSPIRVERKSERADFVEEEEEVHFDDDG